MKDFAVYIKTIHPPLSPEAVKALVGITTELTFKKNADVQVIGHTCRTIYFIKKGALRVYYYKGDTDITETVEFENAFVARIESLVTGQPSRKGIQAIEDSVLIAINADQLIALYDTYIEI